MKRFCILGLSLWFGAGVTHAQTNLSPRAEQVLRAACQYLAEAPYFGISAEIWREHVTETGEKVQFTRVVEMEVRRPNRLHVGIHSPHTDRSFWYDGKTLTVLDGRRNFYSTAPMPPTIDQTLDAAHSELGIDLPLIDLAVSDPYNNATARVERATYFGLAQAMGYSCHHLAFTQDNLDWQVWIEDGPQPLIRKFVITHKNEPGSPEFTALIRQWNMTDRIADSDFAFEPPRGAIKVQMRKETMEPSPTPTGRPQEPLTSPKEKD